MEDAIQHVRCVTVTEPGHKPQIQFAERPAPKLLFGFQTLSGLFAQSNGENAYFAI